MRRIVLYRLMAVLAGCNVAAAGSWENKYYDARRTGGHKRSAAAFEIDLKFCARKAGLPFNARAHDLAIDRADPPTFKQCMAGRGLQWQYSRRKSDEPRWTVRINHPDDMVTPDNSSPPPLVLPPPIVEPQSPPMSIYDPQVNPGVFMHRDDPPIN